MKINEEVIVDSNSEKYLIKNLIDENKIWQIYKAINTKSEKEVALKIFNEELTSGYIEDLIRFKNETIIASGFDHINIVKQYGIGEYNNNPFLIEELPEGDSLANLLLNNLNFNIDDSFQIINQLTGALIYSHNKGIIYKYITPDNIIVTKKKL